MTEGYEVVLATKKKLWVDDSNHRCFRARHVSIAFARARSSMPRSSDIEGADAKFRPSVGSDARTLCNAP
jgi:hypothetical protein